MVFPWMVIPAAISAGTSLYQLLGAKKASYEMSPELREALGLAKRRMEQGLFPEEESAMANPMIMRAQSGMASALASRGMSDSSAADMGLASIYSGVADAVGRADVAMRGQGMEMYGGLTSLEEQQRTGFEERKAAGEAGGWAGLAESFGMGFSALNDYLNPEESIGDILRSIYGSENGDIIEGSGEGNRGVWRNDWWQLMNPKLQRMRV